MERSVASVPLVVMRGRARSAECALILTNRRSIFAFGEAARSLISRSVVETFLPVRKRVRLDVDKLAREERSVVIPHSRIVSIRLRRGFSAHELSEMYTLRLQYKDGSGKRHWLSVYLTPPDGLIKLWGAMGHSQKNVLDEYAMGARNALEAALPPTVARRVRWDV